MNIINVIKKRWIWIFGGIALLIIIIIVNGSKEQPIYTNTQPQVTNVQQETQVKVLTSEQKSIQEFLVKELDLDDELQRGNNEVANAGYEFDNGVPLPYIIKAELIFENVLKESKALVVPLGGEKVNTYLIETANGMLSGVKKIKEGLESYPVNKTKLGQGLEILNKAQTSYARKNAEIIKLKQEAGI